MLYRQDLERHANLRKQQKREAISRLNHLEGQLSRLDPENDAAEIAEIGVDLEIAHRRAIGLDFVVQDAEYLLRELDLEETNDGLVDRMKTIPLELEKDG